MTTPKESALSGWAKEAAAEEVARRAEAKARRAAGMGFWRLVFVVAFGVLLARGIGAAVLWAAGKLLQP